MYDVAEMMIFRDADSQKMDYRGAGIPFLGQKTQVHPGSSWKVWKYNGKNDCISAGKRKSERSLAIMNMTRGSIRC
jgi:hypothetical protein